MRRAYRSGAAAAAPTAPAAPSTGYPTEGDSATLVPATTPGAYWYHAVTEEIVGVIEAAGLTADDTVVQLLAAIRTLITATAATETARGTVELATVAEARAGTDRTRAVTPAGVSAALQGSRMYLGGVSTTTAADVDMNISAEALGSTLILLISDTTEQPGSVANAHTSGVVLTSHLRAATSMTAVGWRLASNVVVAGRLIQIGGRAKLRLRRHTSGRGVEAVEFVWAYAIW